MSKMRKVNISSEEAIEDALRFVEDDESDDESDLDSLFGDDGIEMEIAKIDNNSYDSDSENQSIVEPSTNRKHRRKSLTYQRLVNSALIDSALVEDNFELFDLPENRTSITGELPDPSSKKKGAKKKLLLLINLEKLWVDTTKKAYDFFVPP